MGKGGQARPGRGGGAGTPAPGPLAAWPQEWTTARRASSGRGRTREGVGTVSADSGWGSVGPSVRLAAEQSRSGLSARARVALRGWCVGGCVCPAAEGACVRGWGAIYSLASGEELLMGGWRVNGQYGREGGGCHSPPETRGAGTPAPPRRRTRATVMWPAAELGPRLTWESPGLVPTAPPTPASPSGGHRPASLHPNRGCADGGVRKGSCGHRGTSSPRCDVCALRGAACFQSETRVDLTRGPGWLCRWSPPLSSQLGV